MMLRPTRREETNTSLHTRPAKYSPMTIHSEAPSGAWVGELTEAGS